MIGDNCLELKTVRDLTLFNSGLYCPNKQKM